jgi:hypothetical protein
MDHLNTPWGAMDRRPAHMRDVEETIHCECGAIVVERFGELHHVGECNLPVTTEENTND